MEIDSGIKKRARTGLSHRIRTAKTKSPRLKQIANLMHLHSKIVPERSRRYRDIGEMTALRTRTSKTSELVRSNGIVRSSLAFLAKLINSWF